MPNLEYALAEKQDSKNGNAEIQVTFSLNGDCFNANRIMDAAKRVIELNYGFRCIDFRLRPIIQSFGLDNAVVIADAELRPLDNLLKGARIVVKKEDRAVRREFRFEQEFYGDPSAPAGLFDSEMRELYKDRFQSSEVKNLRIVLEDGKRKVSFDYNLYLSPEETLFCFEGCQRVK